jgi:hypothetical protein
MKIAWKPQKKQKNAGFEPKTRDSAERPRLLFAFSPALPYYAADPSGSLKA